MLETIKLDGDSSEITIEQLTAMIGNHNIKVIGFYNHTKASEKYVVLSISDNANQREWVLPYVYRRTNTQIDSANDLCAYIKAHSESLTKDAIDGFIAEIRKHIPQFFGKAPVTIPIFKMLLARCGKWVCNMDFGNPNSQRRIQDIKERGFTLVTKIEGKRTFHELLPFPPVQAPCYETIPTKIRKRIFALLNNIDAYSGKRCTISVLPDHKFPEIRWDKDTAIDNNELSDEEIRVKFQLVPEAINQAKREICRKCFQSGIRGCFCGIDFFYRGSENWPQNIPRSGKSAEAGCIGCFWYDMAVWRGALNKLLKERHEGR